MGHDVVYLLGRRHAVFDEPERLAPNSLQQTISNMGRDFCPQRNRLHANVAQQRFHALHRLLGHRR